ncbi:MAG: 5'-nucleotidase C-terminal domain-containing protein, partial [Clostridia bacterium]|nr:5'-nucleotidase C-terminal domain-containing protein [Clostridia bacterium]
MKRKLAALLVILNIFICFSLPCSAESGAGSGLNIVFTGNIHSHIENYSYISDYIRNERTANPDTIALDCGNFSAGTVYQTLFTSFAPELRLAGASGYDAVALGAYEYSYGADGIKEMLLTAGKSHETLPAILCADPAEVVPASDRYDNAVKRYTLIKRGGYSVAVFSVYDTESFKEAANITDEVKKLYTPDLIVCLFGAKMLTRDFAYEKKLAASADIDLIISANENLIYGDPLYSDGTFIVPAGVNGLQAGEITFEFSNGKIYCKRYVYTTKESYKSTDSAVAAKAAGFAEYVESYFNAYGYESADKVIAKSTYSLPFEPSDEKSASLYELIADSFVSCVRELEDKQFNGVDIVLISVNSIGNGINEGNITVSDIFSILPFGDRAHVTCGSPLCSFYIKGDEIINLCEADMSLSNTDPELEYYISGVHYRANTARIKFNRVFGCMLTDDYGV